MKGVTGIAGTEYEAIVDIIPNLHEFVRGRPAGHFITAVFENDLMQAVSRADIVLFWEVLLITRGSRAYWHDWRQL